MMKLRFLGTGTSSGVPVLSCTCKVCLSKDPKDTRRRCAAILSYNGLDILFDAGPDIRIQLLEQKIQFIDAILITHAHFDHIVGIDELRPFSWHRPLPIFADQTAMQGVYNFFPYLFDNNPLQKGGGLTKLDPTIIEPSQDFVYKNMTITPLRIMHGWLPIIGYKIHNLAYITDVKEIPPESIEQLKGIDTLVLGCLRETAHPTHFNKDEALAMIDIIKPRVCYFIHMNHELSHKEWADILPPNVHVAYDGLEIAIPL